MKFYKLKRASVKDALFLWLFHYPSHSQHEVSPCLWEIIGGSIIDMSFGHVHFIEKVIEVEIKI